MMLNYVLLDHYGIYHVDHVFKITYEMLLAFFMDYALSEKKEGGYRGSQSVNKCVSAVTLFMEKLRRAYGSHMVLKHKDLYTDRVVYVKGRRTRRSSPNFTVYTVPEEKKIFRDMPTKVFTILMKIGYESRLIVNRIDEDMLGMAKKIFDNYKKDGVIVEGSFVDDVWVLSNELQKTKVSFCFSDVEYKRTAGKQIPGMSGLRKHRIIFWSC